jgi:hypothetical protein
MDVIKQIDEDLEAINRHWEDPNELSALILRLSLRYGDLGDLVTEAELEMDEQKATLDYTQADLIRKSLNLDQTAAWSAANAKAETQEQIKSYLTAKASYGKLKRKRDSVEKIIDAARSRLSLIKSDIRLGG